jgi:hypothetical protein
LPKARSLYGPISTQLQNSTSFATQLRNMLRVRRQYKLYNAHQIDIPDVQSPGLLVMLHELPEEMGKQVTAINFGADPIDETVALRHVGPGRFMNMFTDQFEGDLIGQGVIRVQLGSYEWKSYLIMG